MDDSKNQGFTVLDREQMKFRVRFFGETYVWTKGEETRIPEGLQKLMEAKRQLQDLEKLHISIN